MPTLPYTGVGLRAQQQHAANASAAAAWRRRMRLAVLLVLVLSFSLLLYSRPKPVASSLADTAFALYDPKSVSDLAAKNRHVADFPADPPASRRPALDPVASSLSRRNKHAALDSSEHPAEIHSDHDDDTPEDAQSSTSDKKKSIPAEDDEDHQDHENGNGNGNGNGHGDENNLDPAVVASPSQEEKSTLVKRLVVDTPALSSPSPVAPVSPGKIAVSRDPSHSPPQRSQQEAFALSPTRGPVGPSPRSEPGTNESSLQKSPSRFIPLVSRGSINDTSVKGDDVSQATVHVSDESSAKAGVVTRTGNNITSNKTAVARISSVESLSDEQRVSKDQSAEFAQVIEDRKPAAAMAIQEPVKRPEKQ